jgi:hypothetical protein
MLVVSLSMVWHSCSREAKCGFSCSAAEEAKMCSMNIPICEGNIYALANSVRMRMFRVDV